MDGTRLRIEDEPIRCRTIDLEPHEPAFGIHRFQGQAPRSPLDQLLRDNRLKDGWVVDFQDTDPEHSRNRTRRNPIIPHAISHRLNCATETFIGCPSDLSLGGKDQACGQDAIRLKG